jgi:hypothetical protein
VETNLPGYTDVSDVEGNPLDNTINVELPPGQNVTDRDFVDERPTPPTSAPTPSPTAAPLVCISGNVMEDIDNNDTGDVNIPMVTITLTDSSTGSTTVTTTDSNGDYIFCNLVGGSYVVVETNLPGYTDVSDVEGNPLDNTINVQLPPGQNVTDRDFVDERPSPSPTSAPTAIPITSAPIPPAVTLAPTPPDNTNCSNNYIETCLCGSEIKVSFSNCQPEKEDWVGLYPCKQDGELTYNYHPTMWLWSCYDGACVDGQEKYSNTLVFNDTLPAYTDLGPHQWPLPSGCYVAILNRNYGLSPPPYDIIIEGQEFFV